MSTVGQKLLAVMKSAMGETDDVDIEGGSTTRPSIFNETAVEPKSSLLQVLYNDQDIVVLDKPAGLRTVPGKTTTEGSEATRAQTEWHSGTKRSRQEFWTDVVHNACSSMLEDEETKGDEAFRTYLSRLTRENNVPRKRSKFVNYTTVTLGLQGEEGDAVSTRIWNAVDSRLKLEAGPGSDCLLTRAKERWPDARHIHRLDQDTSGVVVMALTLEAAREMCRQFREREPSKTYTAVLEDRMAKSPKQGTAVAKMRPNRNDRPRQMLDEEKGKPAETRWKRISSDKDRTRVEFTPVTGRTHQIRMHALSLGHPIVGDSLYGTEEGKAKSERLLLHATKLSFTHPRTSEKMEFESSPPF